jgi:hypothetical protein
MISKKRYIYMSSISFIVFLGSFQEGLSCSIEQGPTPRLNQYFQDIQKEVATLRAEATKNNLCTGKNGSFSEENRFLDTLDKVDVQLPSW